MTVHDEAVEAAVRASYLRHDWDNQNERQYMKRALEAAAPFMNRAENVDD